MIKDFSIGVVTFLDVLGWKGVWQRGEDPCLSLCELAKSLRKNASPEKIRGRFVLDAKIEQGKTEVTIISDTIVICTQANENNAVRAIDLHGELCSQVIPNSIISGLPLRGATAFGEYYVLSEEKIFVGKAIDEAASWHELAEWIGVFLTPSSLFSIGEEALKYWIKYKVPLKDNQNFNTQAVLWDNSTKNEIKRNFVQMSPILPNVIKKFENTIHFMSQSSNAAIDDLSHSEKIGKLFQSNNYVKIFSNIITENKQSIHANIETQVITLHQKNDLHFVLNFNGRLLNVPFSMIKHAWPLQSGEIGLILHYSIFIPADTVRFIEVRNI